MRLGGDPKKVKPFLKAFFLRMQTPRALREVTLSSKVEKRYWLDIAIDRFDDSRSAA
jgi:hypothetical protein